MPAGHVFAVISKEWRVINREEHAHRWFIHLNGCERVRLSGVRHCIANFKARKTDNGANITGGNRLSPCSA